MAAGGISRHSIIPPAINCFFGGALRINSIASFISGVDGFATSVSTDLANSVQFASAGPSPLLKPLAFKAYSVRAKTEELGRELMKRFVMHC